MALEEVENVAPDSDLEIHVKLLSKPDLEAFLQRRRAVDESRLMTTMVVEGYEAFVRDLRERYGVVGQLSIDARTGQIILTDPEPPADVATEAEEPTDEDREATSG
jgi:hypothetical protein